MERRIGLAFSGGGYRAGAWALGVLLYLRDAGLHDRVVTSSSVSGGSITNAALALQSFGGMSHQGVWQFAARLSRRFAGNLGLFLLLLALHVGAWGTGIVAASMHRPGVARIAFAVAVILSFLFARACGDATFRSPVVWWYCDALGLSLALLGFSFGEGWWLLGAVLLVGVLLLFRGVVVGWAIEGSLLSGTTKGRPRLAHMTTSIDHVLCACDLHGRHHVYFGRDFVYSFGLGLGARPTLPLGAAMQASANLPFAFAPRQMRPAPFRFTGGRYNAGLLALTDGGVYDNMADEWHLSYRERTARFRHRAKEITNAELRKVLGEAASRMGEREPNFVVIANASGPLGFKFAWTTFVPLIGELLALLRIKSILYDNGNTTRRRLIVDEFIDRDLIGILVHIATDPSNVIRDGLEAQDLTVRKRATAAKERLLSTPGLDPGSTKTPAAAATVLYPLGRGRIAKLLQRSYALACVQGHIWHDLPLVDIPSLAWFEGLEAGRVDKRPMPPEFADAVSDELRSLEPGESVPVCVDTDAVRDIEGTSMARVTYFIIASEVPEPMWLIAPPASEFSFEVLGLVGVICGPDRRTPLFENEAEIDTLFEDIEANAGLFVEVEDLWIPIEWLGPGGDAKRGDVYRLRLPLFHAAYRFRAEQMSVDQFLRSTPWQGAALFSQEETRAFQAWAQARIDEARSVYPKDERLALSYREDGG